MTPRLITLAVSTALLTLSGCASQQTETDPLAASSQRLNTLESRLQSDSNSNLVLIHELGKKVDLLAAELRQQRESANARASDQANAGAARQALADRLNQVEKQLQSVTGDNRATAARDAETQAALSSLREQAKEAGRQIDRLAAQLDHVSTEHTLALQAETTELEERLQAAEDLLEEMTGRLQDGQARTEAVEATLPGLTEKTDGNAQRLAALAAQLDAAQAEHAATLETATSELGKRLEAAEKLLEEMAGRIQDGQARTETLAAALPGLSAKTDGNSQQLAALSTQTRTALDQAAAAQAALPALREKAAAADARLTDYDARLAALNKRLDEVARMAQDAYDATGLGQRKIFGKVVDSITLTEDRTLFPINSPDLGEQDKAKLDALVLRLKALGTNYHLQIQGHTEGFGADDYNYELGKARAEVVKNYLKEKGGIPLLRMSVMSYGSLEAAGQIGKSNRRVVVQVLQ